MSSHERRPGPVSKFAVPGKRVDEAGRLCKVKRIPKNEALESVFRAAQAKTLLPTNKRQGLKNPKNYWTFAE